MKGKGWLKLDEHEVGRPHLRLKNPVYTTDGATQTSLEVIAQDLYDYGEIELNTVTQKISFFAIPAGQMYTPIGGTAFQKNNLHTNLESQGAVLPNPQRFMTKGMQAIRRPDIAMVDLTALDYQSLVTFVIGDSKKPYFVGLLAKIPAASGIMSASTTGAAPTPASVNALTQGWPVSGNIYHLLADANDPGVIISQGQNFNVLLDPTLQIGGAFTTAAAAAAGTGIHIWMTLVGTLARSVQ
ncbi:MAG: hypothetical protein ACRD3D_13180 [Terriglobia bacterium]